CRRGACGAGAARRPADQELGEPFQMLSDTQRAAYQREGVIVVPEVFSPAEIDELRRVTDEFVRNSASVVANDEIYDLEDTHSPRSASWSMMSRWIPGRCWWCRAATRARSTTITGRMAGSAPRWTPPPATSIYQTRCRASARPGR